MDTLSEPIQKTEIRKSMIRFIRKFLRKTSLTKRQKSKRNEILISEMGSQVESLKFLDLPQEVFLVICGFFDSPKELCSLSRSCKRLAFLCNEESLWRYYFQQKWPWFYDTYEMEKTKMVESDIIVQQELEPMKKQEPSWSPPNQLIHFENWKQFYQDVHQGKQKFILQVYERESNHGFMRSYYDGLVSYLSSTASIRVQYFPHLNTTSPPKEEIIKPQQYDRLKCVPVEIRHNNPFNVFLRSKPEQLSVGDEVEVQWRNNPDGAFGWWHGIIDTVSHYDGNQHQTTTEHGAVVFDIVFSHYPPTSPWFRLRLPSGLQKPLPCRPSGWLGSIRKLTPPELQVMKSHFKKYE